MNKKQKREKQLLENLDRIVAGEKLKDDSGLDKDTKAALEVTREMTNWPKSPSKEFKAKLKADLTHRVVEQLIFGFYGAEHISAVLLLHRVIGHKGLIFLVRPVYPYE